MNFKKIYIPPEINDIIISYLTIDDKHILKILPKKLKYNHLKYFKFKNSEIEIYKFNDFIMIDDEHIWYKNSLNKYQLVNFNKVRVNVIPYIIFVFTFIYIILNNYIYNIKFNIYKWL